jgi:hypothetical protein
MREIGADARGLARPGVKVVFIAALEDHPFTEGVGEALALALDPQALVDAVERMLTPAGLSPSGVASTGRPAMNDRSTAQASVANCRRKKVSVDTGPGDQAVAPCDRPAFR